MCRFRADLEIGVGNAPLADARPFQESLLAWARYAGLGPLATVTSTWHSWLKVRWRLEVYSVSDAAAPFGIFWEGALREGVVVTATPHAIARSFLVAALAGLPDLAAPAEGSLSLVLYAPASLHDGRNGNNAWLHELPDPVTKISWDNAAYLSPATAGRLGLRNGQRVTLTHRGRGLDVGRQVRRGGPGLRRHGGGLPRRRSASDCCPPTGARRPNPASPRTSR